MKLLFVCSQNRLRSLTAETIFDGVDGHQVRSAGTEQGARIRVSAGHLGWADLVFVMEKRHLSRLRQKFRDALEGKRVVCLHIPDDFDYMDEALIDRLRGGVAPYVHPGSEEPATDATTLYRPVGRRELELIAECGHRRFPPRLPHQPIFYPVLTEEYAIAIARDWNCRDEASGFVGYVTRFQVDSRFLARYPVQVVGARAHRELWVPATELGEFNRHIVGVIEIVAEFRGDPAGVSPGET